LLRYRTGDLVTVDPNDCSCGLPGPAVRHFEGRNRDVLRLPDGSALTPRQIDSALASCPGLDQYRCVQETARSVRIEYVHGDLDPGSQIAECLQPLMEGMTITCKSLPFISPEQSGKYRTVVPR
jgi:phenylacetate-coenzyme A ligase PaaK-like adenylate-forming protein